MRRISSPVVLSGCLLLSLGCAGNTTGSDPGTGGTSNPGSAGDGSGGTSGGTSGTTGTGGSSGTAGTSGTPGSGGSSGGNGPGSAGNSGSAGSVSTAGTTGSGGSSAGASGTAGRGGSSGTAGSTGSGGSGSCTITATSMISPMIATVGIVTFTSTMSGPTSAKIDFGLTTSYGMTAPVDLTAANYRTLLLGMKPSKMYNYRVTVTGASGSCQSSNYTIMTGAMPNGMTKPAVTTMNASALAGGFLITGQYVMNSGSSGQPAYILDADGDFVWWYKTSPAADVTGARMDYAGTHMWINNANVPSGTAHVHRVTMDGMMDEDLSTQFAGMNHQLTVLPDETVAFYAYGSNGCEDIKERSPTGTVKTIVNSRTAHGGTQGCHINDIQYSPMDQTLVFSDLDNNCITKIKRDGTVVWVLNGLGAPGITNSFTGDTWLGGEHGIHILGLDSFVIFNNNSSKPGGVTTPNPGSNDGSIALEIKLDLTAKKMMKTWMFKQTGAAYQNDVMGDVQRLPNGNTMVAYSTKGLIVEVNSAGQVLQSMTAANFGYIEKRPTLYGPPPK